MISGSLGNAGDGFLHAVILYFRKQQLQAVMSLEYGVGSEPLFMNAKNLSQDCSISNMHAYHRVVSGTMPKKLSHLGLIISDGTK